jgi:hypothetical protein
VKARDIGKLVAMSHDPFYYERETPLSGKTIEAVYRKVVDTEVFLGEEIEKLTTGTLAERQAEIADERLDRLATNLDLKPDDWLVEVSTRDPTGTRDQATQKRKPSLAQRERVS